ncbi:unnamed protein product [Paramecium sonneborni]|uniref:Protein kinase domain-containing protein n=1 Tax=Paramecium sonneborni TaxID=65129 RepID=A0A8S1RFY8_9CILI|nr:unnamed protein product [Paramecium sonneborni]
MVNHEKLSKADIFCLGLILYQLYFGKLPYGENLKQYKDFIKQTDIERMKNIEKLKKIGYEEQWFVYLVIFMIQTNPDDRAGFQEFVYMLYKKFDKFIIRMQEICLKIIQQLIPKKINIKGDSLKFQDNFQLTNCQNRKEQFLVSNKRLNFKQNQPQKSFQSTINYLIKQKQQLSVKLTHYLAIINLSNYKEE